MRRVCSTLCAAALLTLGACGIDDDAQPRPLDGVVGVESAGRPASGTVSVLLFVVRSNTLSAVVGRVENRAPATVLNALLAGPLSAADQAAGRTTAIPQGTVLRSVAVADGTATVDLSSVFADVQGVGRRLAVAQIVHTLTPLGGIERVRFSLEGQPIRVPGPNGDAVVVDACDSASLLPDQTAVAATPEDARALLSSRLATITSACGSTASE